MKSTEKVIPDVLNTITDAVLAYRPQPKSKGEGGFSIGD